MALLCKECENLQKKLYNPLTKCAAFAIMITVRNVGRRNSMRTPFFGDLGEVNDVGTHSFIRIVRYGGRSGDSVRGIYAGLSAPLSILP